MEADEVGERLRSCLEQHRDLDAAIAVLSAEGGHDQVRLARMKKRKLKLRDEIAFLRDVARPDIIA